MSKLRPGSSIVAIGPFPCPFCDGQFSASEEPPAILHSLPVCTKFTECEPDAFLRAARFAKALS